MSFQNIITELDSEIERLTQVRNMLAGETGRTKSKVVHRRGTMSEEARRKIGEATRKRWAKAKKAGKSVPSAA